MKQAILLLKNKETKPFSTELTSIFKVLPIQDNNIEIFMIEDGFLEDTVSTLEALALDLDLSVRVYVTGFRKNLDTECSLVTRLLPDCEAGVYYGSKLALALPNSAREALLSAIFTDFKRNDSLYNLLEGFFAADLNVSLAANNLYMHRNTLLYRLNSFHQKTGFDLKCFRDAALIYNYLLHKQK